MGFRANERPPLDRYLELHPDPGHYPNMQLRPSKQH